MNPDYNTFIQILASLAIGILIGIERGWSGREEDEGDRIAGIRTFSLIGLLGGIWTQLSSLLNEWMMVAAFLGVVALIIASHIVGARETKDIGVTTEVAMMLTFSLAVWASLGYYIYAFATTVLVITLLGMKPILHKWLSYIKTEEIYSGIKLLIISLVLLPLLPNKGFGPWEALNPYWIWWMVVLISGISFVGYFAIKYAGNKVGTLLTAITGGLASSTAVTLSMAQLARYDKNKSLFMGGVIIASSIMFIRVLVEVAIVNFSLLSQIWLPVAVMFSCLLIGGGWLWYQKEKLDTEQKIEIKNPLNLPTALQFGLLLAVILLLSAATKAWFGDEGVYMLAAASGIVDVDAITLSLSHLSTVDLDKRVASLGIIIASGMNTLVKGFLFSFFVGFQKSIRLIVVLSVSIAIGLGAALLII